jgi:hypothetical protein
MGELEGLGVAVGVEVAETDGSAVRDDVAELSNTGKASCAGGSRTFAETPPWPVWPSPLNPQHRTPRVPDMITQVTPAPAETDFTAGRVTMRG